MTHDEWITRVLAGHTVTDIGQLENRTRAKLNRMAKVGTLVRSEVWHFPAPKTCWFLA